MEKKYECKLWARELTGDKTCRWVSGVVVKDGQVVIQTSTIPCYISPELATAAGTVFQHASNVKQFSVSSGYIFGTKAIEG